jgi:ComF family protein
MGGAGTVVGKLGQAILEFVFPSRCVTCDSGGAFLCDDCAASLVAAAPPRCPACWRLSPAGDRCAACRVEPPPFDGLRAAFVYEGVAREAVQSLKYRGMTALGAPMAAFLAKAVRGYDLTADVIVPVPLAGLRERTRGYNQAAVLAQALGRELGLPVRSRALRRSRNTAPQARSADAQERSRNVAGAFRARPGEVAGRRVLLVDDVTTTGATLGACASALKEGGARSVWGLAFARED